MKITIGELRAVCTIGVIMECVVFNLALWYNERLVAAFALLCLLIILRVDAWAAKRENKS